MVVLAATYAVLTRVLYEVKAASRCTEGSRTAATAAGVRHLVTVRLRGGRSKSATFVGREG